MHHITDKCSICTANGYRRGLIDDISFGTISNVNWNLVSATGYKAGYESGQEQKYDKTYFDYSIKTEPNEPSEPTGLQTVYFFDVPSGQFGEAYHALVTAILMPPTCVAIRPGDKTKETYAPEIDDLLRFYSIRSSFKEKPNSEAKISAKDMTTKVIARYFETYEQSLLFETICNFLDKDPPNSKLSSENASRPHFAPYATQSFLGKYWLNRYFSVTGQLSDEPHKHKLPKYNEVERIAVVVIRRDVKTTAGRVMNEANLEACLKTIVEANEIAKTYDDAKFTHILLYGDIQAPAAKKVVDTYKVKMASKKIQLLYVSKPWKATPDEETAFSKDELFQDTQNFWAEFRAEHQSSFPKSVETRFLRLPDGAPLQVRIFSFFLALQARYREKLCYIGFRSGFLDGAAFIGSPVFYLDDSEWETLKQQGQQPSTTLYQPTATIAQAETRMIKAGNSINTFIRIDVQKVNNLVKLKSPQPILLGALYIYMLAKNPDLTSGVCWEQRCKLRHTEEGQKKLKDLYLRSCK